ncbi:MAG TPA: PIN domain-containing protein [Mucilaginibacter sp.]|nr:PIN domain-containing protein [Mucilaginibacter sp.]
MKVIVDTNIVFSAILNSRGKIGELLLNKPADVEYLSPAFLLEELELHTEKILRIANLSDLEYQHLKEYVIQHISFVEADDITAEHWIKAGEMIKAVDEKDIPFLALVLHVKGSLWTGDKKLIGALQSIKFDNVFSTETFYLKYF